MKVNLVAQVLSSSVKNNENNMDDYSDSPNISTLSQHKLAAISYIAGYLGKKVKDSSFCRECGMVLESVSGEASSSFLVLKDAFTVCWL